LSYDRAGDTSIFSISPVGNTTLRAVLFDGSFGVFMTTPVKVFGDYVACFEAEPETDISMRRHFIKECGWSEAQFRRIKNFAWFSATISIWKDGEELAADFLGACCYRTTSEFYTRYEGDYWCDKVHNCALEINDPVLLASVNQWRHELSQKALSQTSLPGRKPRTPSHAS
jgi:hypothetical protein